MANLGRTPFRQAHKLSSRASSRGISCFVGVAGSGDSSRGTARNDNYRVRPSRADAFSLIELLVVIGIIAILIGLLIPTLHRARYASRRTACLSNLRQIGVAIHMYANDNNGSIPFGPDALPSSTTNFYPVAGTVTSLISLQTGAPVGLGLMLERHLAKTPRVLFCPDPDQPVDGDAELAKVGVAQAQADYFYRHGSGASLTVATTIDHIKLAQLGKNREGNLIRALAMDANLLAHPSLAVFGVKTRTNHARKWVNVVYSDGHAESVKNETETLTVNTVGVVHFSFELMLRAFERLERPNGL
jgi:prepilin-type N-terminal cleavage/methylation domain-containing protein/prepilin-type processing-associated H-X9-DG protein